MHWRSAPQTPPYKRLSSALKLTSLTLSVIVLGACSTTHAPEATPQQRAAKQQQPESWAARQQQLSHITRWHLAGAMAVNDGQQARSASINWRQQANNYTIRIFGPLGVGNNIITGSPKGVSLLNADQQRFNAATATQLLQQQTGWQVPIESLFYWVRGIPKPGVGYDKSLDGQQRLSQLQQQGWHIDYRHYTKVGNVDLPDKIFLSQGPLKVKLAINTWQV